MYFRNWLVRPLRVVSCLSALAVVCFLLSVFPASVTAQIPASPSASSTFVDMPESEEFLSLTTAQQKAKQLATILIGKRETSTISTQKTPLGIIAEQTMHLGRRIVLPLFVASHLEGRLTGGRQTFVSPVDNASTTAKEDARRPLFLSASETIIAVEIVTK
jgi:hypothetical protein